MAEYYQSTFSGEQIDQGIGFIVNGEFERLAEGAIEAAANVQEAIDNIPEGATPIINDLTTGGVSMALSAEQGKVLGDTKAAKDLSNVSNEDMLAKMQESGFTGGGGAGIHIGDEPPTDENIEVWIDTDEESDDSFYTKGEVDGGFVNKAGDTMTGRLKIQSARPFVDCSATDDNSSYSFGGYGQFLGIEARNDADSGANRRILGLFTSGNTSRGSLKDCLAIQDFVDGSYKFYNVLHEGNSGMNLLWENASPNSAFAAQLISLDLSEYEIIIVLAKASMAILKKGFDVCNAVNFSDAIYQRMFTAEDTGVRVYGGFTRSLTSLSNLNANDNVLIPGYIYGIKGVS